MTIIIIGITAIISVLAFQQTQLFEKLKFNAWDIHHRKEWHRFLSYGLIHADWMHLLINMFVLYSFGRIVEEIFIQYFDLRGYIYFILLYAGGIAFSTLVDFAKYKNDVHYNAVGASGAVSAVVFSSIILFPSGKIFLFMIPVGIPAPIFGILYLIYSAYMARRGGTNIGHSAHFWGAIFGIVYTVALKPAFILNFIEQIIPNGSL
jgi:membrane associated rhomboid family serine protease